MNFQLNENFHIYEISNFRKWRLTLAGFVLSADPRTFITVFFFLEDDSDTELLADPAAFTTAVSPPPPLPPLPP